MVFAGYPQSAENTNLNGVSGMSGCRGSSNNSVTLVDACYSSCDGEYKRHRTGPRGRDTRKDVTSDGDAEIGAHGLRTTLETATA